MVAVVRVEPIPQRVAKQVEHDDDEEYGDTGSDDRPRGSLQKIAVVAHHGAPFGHRRLRPQAEKRQARQLHQHGADIENGRDQHRPDDVRHDVARYQLRRSAPGQARCRQIVLVLDGQRQPARDSRILRPGDGGKGDDRIVHAASQDAGNRQGEDQSRECQENVGDAHEHDVNGAAAPSGHHADAQSHDRDDRDQRERAEHRGLRADDDAGKHIPAIAIRSRRMLPVWSLKGLTQILRIRIVRHDELRDRGYDDDGKGKDQEHGELHARPFPSLKSPFEASRSRSHGNGADFEGVRRKAHRRPPPRRTRGSSLW